MKKNIKNTIVFLCSLAFILIAIGLLFSVKDLMRNEDMFNIGDDGSYYKAVFNLNGATLIEYKIAKCKIDNNTCNIVLPKATRDDGVVLGYSDNKNDIKAKYKEGEIIAIDSNIQLYAISYKTNTVTIEKNNVDYLEKSEVSCDVYNEEKECSVVIPSFNKIGYENKGYSTSKDSLVGFKFPHDEYKISDDIILYPIYRTTGRKVNLNISKTFTYRDSFVEVEVGCSESVYKKFIDYLDGISKHSPYLLLGNKIAFVTDKSFDEIWGKNYVGMNYGPRSLRSVDVRCSNNSLNDYYATMVHEMAHSWDFYYANKLGSNISSQSDVINLYNKYKDKSDRPFRDYSYSSIYEFVADMMRYYYFKYEVPKTNFSILNYPADIKKTLEKYICISKNNYNESKCVS